MSSGTKRVAVIGAGLAGCEAAWQIAKRKIFVDLFEMRPAVKSPAHFSNDFGELVCSNSLGNNLPYSAPYILKEELRSFYKAYHEVSYRVHDSKYSSTFRLNAGEVLIVASLRVLHARESFIPKGKRYLQDTYFVYDNALNNCVI